LADPLGLGRLSTSGDGLVGFAGGDGGLAVWRWSDLDADPLVERFHSFMGAWLPTGWFVANPYDPASLSTPAQPVAWNPSTGARRKFLSLDSEWYPCALSVSQGGEWLCVRAGWAATDGRQRLGVVGADLAKVRWVATVSTPVYGPHGTVEMRAVAVSEDGRYVAAGGVKMGAWLLLAGVEEGAVLWETTPPDSVSLADVAFSPDGKVVYAGGGTGRLYAFEVATGRAIRRGTVGEGPEAEYGHRISRVACSLDGRLVAAGTGPRGEVYVWDTRSGERLMTIDTQDATVMGLAFSPDSRLLATKGVFGRTVKVWRMPEQSADSEPST
jgi:outer membrane protein assembly factor BamB